MTASTATTSSEPGPATALGRPRISPKLVRRVVLAVFVLGIAGMIVGSIADNNGTAITFGLVTAVAALALVLVTSVAPTEPAALPVGDADERLAVDLERRIEALVDDGADEEAVRRLVGRAVEMGRQSRS